MTVSDITVSARYSNDCGIVRPICLAVLRLNANSNFIGCSTGRSPGLASLEDSVHVIGDAAVAVGEVGAVGHEPTGSLHARLICVHRRQTAFKAKLAIRFPLALISGLWVRKVHPGAACSVAAKTFSNPSASRTSQGLDSQPELTRRGGRNSFISRVVARLAGSSRRIATRASLGTASLSSSSRFPPSFPERFVMPVTLPPGRARLSISPASTGSTHGRS